MCHGYSTKIAKRRDVIETVKAATGMCFLQLASSILMYTKKKDETI
jgi:hypothetical protein